MSGNVAATGGGREDREDVRTYGPVRNTCLRELVLRVSLVSVWPSIREGDDVLPSVTVHHLPSIIPASLVPFSLPSATEDDTAAAAAAPGK